MTCLSYENLTKHIGPSSKWTQWHHLIECKLFSPWYSWKISLLALNNNHSLSVICSWDVYFWSIKKIWITVILMFYGPFIQMKLITIAQRFRPTLDMVEGCHGHDRMVVRFITTYSVAMFEPRSGEVYSIQHYVIKFVCDFWQVSGFLRVLRFIPSIKLTATI